MGVRLSGDSDLTRKILAASPMFTGWPAGDLDTLQAISELWRYEKGEVLCFYSDEVKGLWIVAEGSLVSHRDNREGRRMIHGVVMPGEHYGLAPLFDGRPAMNTVSARSETATVVFLPRAPLLDLLRGNADFLLQIILTFANRMRLDYERVQIGLNSSIRSQLAKFIGYYSGEDFHPLLDAGAVDWAPPIVLTQGEIAAMMGVSRQSVSEEMAAMVREGVLRRQEAQFCVADYHRLLAIMEEDEPLPPQWRDYILDRRQRIEQRSHPSRSQTG